MGAYSKLRVSARAGTPRTPDYTLGHYLGGRVTYRPLPSGEFYLTVSWWSGARWDLGPYAPRRDAFTLLLHLKGSVMGFLKKSDHLNATGSGLVVPPGGILGQCPVVTEYLTSTVWDDGTPRERSTLIVVIEAGMLKVCLSDKATGRSLWRSGSSLEEVIQGMEEVIVFQQADWRTSRPQQGRANNSKK
jgi:hypothetical protein